MYIFNSRVRYSETDEKGCLSVPGIINYMQDCSTFQSEDARVGISYLDENHKAWLLSSWQIVIDRCPGLGEHLTVGTWPCAFKGIYGYRAFTIKDGMGRDCVRAHSVWFLYDTEKNMPIRVCPEDTAPYGCEEPPPSMPPAPRKLLQPERYVQGLPIVAAGHHMDTNHHVNNAQYVAMAKESIPEGLEIKEIRADYKKAAVLGSVLIPRVSQGPDQEWTVTLADEDGEAYAIVWLRTRELLSEGAEGELR